MFYRSGDKMMTVDIQTIPTFRAGTPKVLSRGKVLRVLRGVGGRPFPDGQAAGSAAGQDGSDNRRGELVWRTAPPRTGWKLKSREYSRSYTLVGRNATGRHLPQESYPSQRIGIARTPFEHR
jgi:hypothetical protein